MTHQELKDYLCKEFGNEEIVVLEPEYYDGGIVGTDEGGCLIYDYYKLAEAITGNDGMTHEDAIEWIDYNTIRAIPYMGIYHPYIMFSYWDIDTDSIIGLDESGRIAYDYDDHDGEEIIPIPEWLKPCIVGKTHDEMLVFDKKMLEERVAVPHDDGDMVIGIVMTPLNTKE